VSGKRISMSSSHRILQSKLRNLSSHFPIFNWRLYSGRSLAIGKHGHCMGIDRNGLFQLTPPTFRARCCAGNVGATVRTTDRGGRYYMPNLAAIIKFSPFSSPSPVPLSLGIIGNFLGCVSRDRPWSIWKGPHVRPTCHRHLQQPLWYILGRSQIQ